MPYDDDKNDDDAALHDRELPDEADLEAAGEAELSDDVPCPYCGKPLYEESEVCTFCGNSISREDAPNRAPLWFFITAVVLVIVVIKLWR